MPLPSEQHQNTTSEYTPCKTDTHRGMIKHMLGCLGKVLPDRSLFNMSDYIIQHVGVWRARPVRALNMFRSFFPKSGYQSHDMSISLSLIFVLIHFLPNLKGLVKNRQKARLPLSVIYTVYVIFSFSTYSYSRTCHNPYLLSSHTP